MWALLKLYGIISILNRFDDIEFHLFKNDIYNV